MGVRMDNLISLHRMRPMILVFPDGRIGGSTYSDSEWANTRSGAYESYVLDVVRDVDARFATIAARGARVIAGFSMGAYGATNIALHHPEVFGNLQSWSGYYVETRTGVFAGAGRATLAYNSPLHYVHRLRRSLRADPLRAFLFTGRDDNSSPQLEPMARALAAAGRERPLRAVPRRPRLAAVARPSRPDADPGLARLQRAAEPRPGPRAVADPGRRADPPWKRPPLDPPPTAPTTGAPTHPPRAAAPHTSGATGADTRAPWSRTACAATTARGPARQPARSSAATTRVREPGVRPAPLGTGQLLGGLLLALVSAALINLGFLLQHRGLGLARRPGDRGHAVARPAQPHLARRPGARLGRLRRADRLGGDRPAVAGPGVRGRRPGAVGAAGGEVLLASDQSRPGGDRDGRSPSASPSLPIGAARAPDRLNGELPGPGGHARPGRGRERSGSGGTGARRALAAGILYGVADAAIKAVSVSWHGPHGSPPAGWLALAALATVARFPGLPVRPAAGQRGQRDLADERAGDPGGAGLRSDRLRRVTRRRNLRRPRCTWWRSPSCSAGYRCWPRRRPSSPMRCSRRPTGWRRRPPARGGPGRCPGGRGRRRGSAHPALNTSASSTGPSPGRRLSTTSLNRRLRARA